MVVEFNGAYFQLVKKFGVLLLEGCDKDGNHLPNGYIFNITQDGCLQLESNCEAPGVPLQKGVLKID